MLEGPDEETVFAAMADLVEVMESVTEPRGRQGRRHLLSDILTIAVLGCMCGCDDAEALEDWGLKEECWLQNYLELPAGIPSQDTYLRVLAAIDEREFRGAFMVWARRTFPRAFEDGQIALDGKTARRSGDKAFEQKAVHMVSALACEYDLVLAQQPTEDKSNELNVPAMQQPEAYVGEVHKILGGDGKVNNEGSEQFLRGYMSAFAKWVATNQG